MIENKHRKISLNVFYRCFLVYRSKREDANFKRLSATIPDRPHKTATQLLDMFISLVARQMRCPVNPAKNIFVRSIFHPPAEFAITKDAIPPTIAKIIPVKFSEVIMRQPFVLYKKIFYQNHIVIYIFIIKYVILFIILKSKR